VVFFGLGQKIATPSALSERVEKTGAGSVSSLYVFRITYYHSPVESPPPPSPGIGSLNETTLHADLKRWYAQPGDRLETKVDGYVVDIVREDLLIEIQTRNFSQCKRKLHKLTERHPVRLIYPIPQEKWIVRLAADGETRLSRRKSPRRGRLEQLFAELVRLPGLIAHPNFSLEVVFIQMEEIQLDDGRGSWRRKGRSIQDRRLLEVVSQREFLTPEDFLALLPPGLPALFTTRDLARALAQPRYVAQKMAYCLSRMGVLVQAGKRGNYYLYGIAPAASR
jgi:hypothetical protein